MNDRSLLGTAGLDKPDLVGPVNFVDDPRGGDHRWFTGDNFALEPLGTFGTVNRRPFHGPGFNNWNLTLAKNTAIRESMRFEVRADLFNAFNHAQFNAPSGFFSATAISVESPRRKRRASFNLAASFTGERTSHNPSGA